MADDLHAAERIEKEAMADVFDAAPLTIKSSLGVRTERRRGVVALIAPGIPTPLFNRALGLGVDQTATEELVDELIELYRGAGVKSFWLHVSPATSPETVPSWLTARGFSLAQRRTWVKVLRGTEEPPSVETPFDVRAIEPYEVEALTATLAAAHGMPPSIAPWLEAIALRDRWRAYGAFDAGAPIAGGLLFRAENRAWLGFGATLSWHRGKGAHGALMSARIRDAIASGCIKIGTETGEPLDEEKSPSLDNMMRMGFRNVGSRLNFELTFPADST